jgi:uncharacterized protein DUF3887
MKKFLLPSLLMLFSFTIKAQDASVKTAENFLDLYNAGQYDRADSLEAPKFKETMPLSTPAQFQRLLNQYGKFAKVISTESNLVDDYYDVKLNTSYTNADIIFRFAVGKDDGLIRYFALDKITRK